MAVSVRAADTFSVTPLGPLGHVRDAGPSIASEPGETVAAPEIVQRFEEDVLVHGVDEATEHPMSAGPSARATATTILPAQTWALRAFNTAPLSQRPRKVLFECRSNGAVDQLLPGVGRHRHGLVDNPEVLGAGPPCVIAEEPGPGAPPPGARALPPRRSDPPTSPANPSIPPRPGCAERPRWASTMSDWES